MVMHMKKIFTIAITATALLMGACQQNNAGKPQEQAEAKVLPPLHLGAVHQVYPQQGFALLRIIGPMPKGGTVLISHPADGSNTRVGNLVVTSDRPARNNIIAAEIRSGNVAQGDRIFMYRNIAAPEEQPEEETTETETPVVEPTPQPQPVLPATEEEDTPAESTVSEDAPKVPAKKDKKEHKIPSHIYDIPDDINDWD